MLYADVTIEEQKSTVYVQVQGHDLVRIDLQTGEVVVWNQLKDEGSEPAWTGIVDLEVQEEE